ncbi:peroxiredoxin [Lacticaseibacillus kribbianus]|uniref:thiol peroxidase n=1 Tax=Lacticaseibacillus kribbianus TaxID=2926292 RepID=UPI001CD66FB8|nr:peroxiredoxin [Lacticaseibacillus kribbianus]
MQITRHGTPLQTSGDPARIGQALPSFTLQDASGKPVGPADWAGKYTLISVVPDINTRVCSVSTKRFNAAMDDFTGINFITVSTNPATVQQSWCAAEGVSSIQLLSDEQGDFGRAMGLLVADGNTDARSVWVVDPTGKISYRELVLEQTDEPDYDSALAYLETHAH